MSSRETTQAIDMARPSIRPAPQPSTACDPVLRRELTLPGIPQSIRQARRWPLSFLPPCDARDDLETIISELATNAIQHTASGQPDGTFTLDISWWRAPVTAQRTPADFLRLVVGDQGSGTHPHLIRDADGERNRGLLMVDTLAARWGTTGTPEGRSTWADIPWTARGGPAYLSPSISSSSLFIERSSPSSSAAACRRS